MYLDTEFAISSKFFTLVLQKDYLANLKQQSGANLVWPTGRNDILTSLCNPTIVRHIKYHIMYFYFGHCSYQHVGALRIHLGHDDQKSGEAKK